MGTIFIEDELLQRSSSGVLSPMRDGDSIEIDEISTDKISTNEIDAIGSAGLKLYDDDENGIFIEDGGNVGIGEIDPDTILQISNNKWFSAKNYAGTGALNMFKANTDDEIDCGGTLVLGATEAEEDSGAIVMMDMPVSATPVAGTEMSYSYRIDGDSIMTIYAEADSAGGIQNPGIVTQYQINLKEMTTPTAIADFGAIYCKSDNKLYFQDGAGVEHEIAFV